MEVLYTPERFVGTWTGQGRYAFLGKNGQVHGLILEEGFPCHNLGHLCKIHPFVVDQASHTQRLGDAR